MEGERLERQYRQITGNYITISEECCDDFCVVSSPNEKDESKEITDELNAAKTEDWVVLGK